MKLQAFLIVSFIILGLVAGFCVKAPPPIGMEKVPVLAQFLNKNERKKLLGMDINDFINNYAGGGMSVHGTASNNDSLIEFYVDNDKHRLMGRFLRVYFNGEKVKRAEVTTKPGLVSAHENQTILGDLILR